MRRGHLRLPKWPEAVPIWPVSWRGNIRSRRELHCRNDQQNRTHFANRTGNRHLSHRFEKVPPGNGGAGMRRFTEQVRMAPGVELSPDPVPTTQPVKFSDPRVSRLYSRAPLGVRFRLQGGCVGLVPWSRRRRACQGRRRGSSRARRAGARV